MYPKECFNKSDNEIKLDSMFFSSLFFFFFAGYVENMFTDNTFLYIEEFIFKIYTNIYILFTIEKLIYQEFSAHYN